MRKVVKGSRENGKAEDINNKEEKKNVGEALKNITAAYGTAQRGPAMKYAWLKPVGAWKMMAAGTQEEATQPQLLHSLIYTRESARVAFHHSPE